MNPYRDIAEQIEAAGHRKPLTRRTKAAIAVIIGFALLNVGAAMIGWPLTLPAVGAALIANVLIGGFVAACPAWYE